MKTLLVPEAIKSLGGLLEANIKTYCFYVDIHSSLNPNLNRKYDIILGTKYLKEEMDLKPFYDEYLGCIDNNKLRDYSISLSIYYVFDTGMYMIVHRDENSGEKRVVHVDLAGLLNYISLNLYN